jgi:hypothetical protein
MDYRVTHTRLGHVTQGKMMRRPIEGNIVCAKHTALFSAKGKAKTRNKPKMREVERVKLQGVAITKIVCTATRQLLQRQEDRPLPKL